jgi:hypothetical protein
VVLTGNEFYATLVSMYIRKTSIKSRKDGSQYYSYRLVDVATGQDTSSFQQPENQQ